MLYFSKIKLAIIYTIIFLLIGFSSLNLLDFKEESFFKKKINLGLDLRGGSYLLLEVDVNPLIKQKLQNKLISLRTYFKENNYKYSNLKVKNNKLIFNLNPDKIILFKDYIQNKDNELNPYYDQYNSFQFDLSINGTETVLTFSKFGIVEINKFALDQSLEIVRRRINETGTKEPSILKRGSNRILIELPGIKDPNRIKQLLGRTANLSFRLVSEMDSSEFGNEILFNESTNNEISVNKRVILSGDSLVDAQPKMDTLNNEPIVSFSLDRVGSKRFGKATSENVGKRLAIVLDDKVISAPSIREPILGGNGQISGNFTFKEATDLALLLRSGALPAPLNIIEERTVGPDLGKDSIKAGLISLIIGFSLVVIFMILKYKILGLVANLSLILNLLILLGFLTLLEATLTLPGIAGIILTVGMSVDANVLIYERIKEEIKFEKSNMIAFDIGYRKSQTAILDANITTLISAIILFSLGSGPVKGFAITLGIGILTTLFTIYFFARHLTSMYVRKYKEGVIKL